MGGGRRLDLPINLIALCRNCHNQAGSSIKHSDLQMIVALRERMHPKRIFRRLWKLLQIQDCIVERER
jgi:hypothetical protein